MKGKDELQKLQEICPADADRQNSPEKNSGRDNCISEEALSLSERERIMRIREMEARLDRAVSGLKETEKALDGYERVREDLRVLADYYGSPLWKEDFSADEAGMLPHDLKRGVLSEDGIYNVLQENDELCSRMRMLPDAEGAE